MITLSLKTLPTPPKTHLTSNTTKSEGHFMGCVSVAAPCGELFLLFLSMQCAPTLAKKVRPVLRAWVREETPIPEAKYLGWWTSQREPFRMWFIETCWRMKPSSVRADVFARTLVARSRGLSQTGHVFLQKEGCLMSRTTYLSAKKDVLHLIKQDIR